MRRKLIAGNWKMNKLPSEVPGFFEQLEQGIGGNHIDNIDVLFAVPFTHFSVAKEVLYKKRNFALAAQNIHQSLSGAFTGEVSISMIKDLGISWTLIGHSERRQYFNEVDEIVSKKVELAQKEGLFPILCVGETLTERQSGQMAEVLERQLAAVFGLCSSELPLVIAYEPVWAIGTGLTASPEQADEAHILIRKFAHRYCGQNYAEKLRILYGGSVTAANAKGLLGKANIDGALIGGASLKPMELSEIICQAASIR